MPLKMRIECRTHGNAPVVPAGDQFHFLPQMADNGSTPDDTEFKLDAADLYCMGGTGDHEFVATVSAGAGGVKAFDGQSVDIIV